MSDAPDFTAPVPPIDNPVPAHTRAAYDCPFPGRDWGEPPVQAGRAGPSARRREVARPRILRRGATARRGGRLRPAC